MSLDWFKFRAKAFITDTQRLNTEARGAYLLLMLNYYEEESPPPDDDMVLATVTGLPMEVWLRYRPLIAPKFEIAGGVWRHAYVEAEIEDCHKRHDKAVSAATSKRSPKQGPTLRSRSTAETPAPSPASPKVSSEVISEHASEVLPKLKPFLEPSLEQSSEVSHLDRDKDSKKEGANAPSAAREVFGPIPANFTMTGRDVIACQSEGYSAEQIAPVFASFFRYHETAGTMDLDWNAAWWRWWNKNKPALHPAEKPKAKAAPRVEVSRRQAVRKAVRPVPDDWGPGSRHWELAIEYGLNLESEVESFRDHCKNKPTDWTDYDAAFRNWLKSPYRQRTTPNGKAPGPSRLSRSITAVGDRLIDDLDRRIEAAESADAGGDPPVQGLPKV